MPELAELKNFISKLSGSSLFGAGIVGSVSTMQAQTDELKRAFAIWYGNQANTDKKTEFEKALLTAHMSSVITTEELKWCQEQISKE